MLLVQKENQVNKGIPDNGGLTDAIKVNQDGSIASIKVAVSIEHPFIGDLKIDLVSPAGTSVTLHDREGGSADNIELVYEGDAVAAFMGESVKGEWTLFCQDFAPRDAGALKSWSIEMRCEQKRSEIFIPEEEGAWLISEQVCNTSGVIENAFLSVNIQHPFQGDLVVKLVCPSGEEVLLHDREGGSVDNLEVSYDLDKLAPLKGQNTFGTWTLMVQDQAPRDSGSLKSWKIGFHYQKQDEFGKMGLSDEQVNALHNNGVHSYGRIAGLGTAQVMNLLGIEDRATANLVLDKAKMGMNGELVNIEEPIAC